jgi:hypothetical protein
MSASVAAIRSRPHIHKGSAGLPHRLADGSDAPPFVVCDRTGMPADGEREDPLVSHVRNLDELVDTGESEKTPLILLGRVWIVTAAAVLLILVLATLAYYLAT